MNFVFPFHCGRTKGGRIRFTYAMAVQHHFEALLMCYESSRHVNLSIEIIPSTFYCLFRVFFFFRWQRVLARTAFFVDNAKRNG